MLTLDKTEIDDKLGKFSKADAIARRAVQAVTDAKAKAKWAIFLSICSERKFDIACDQDRGFQSYFDKLKISIDKLDRM